MQFYMHGHFCFYMRRISVVFLKFSKGSKPQDKLQIIVFSQAPSKLIFLEIRESFQGWEVGKC